ncbi:MAG TPA: hypothetical protein PKL29_03965, partial [Methanothrix sp.]|nr:hypothetical protein [Methanothrix sp.]
MGTLYFLRALMRLMKAPWTRIAIACLMVAAILFMCSSMALSAGHDNEGKNAAEVIFIESPGCTKCAAAERVLEKIGQDTPINISRHYYYSEDGHRIIKQYGAKDVPAIIIGMQVINYRDYEEDDSLLEKLIREALANQTQPVQAAFSIPATPGNESDSGNESKHSDQDLQLNLKELSAYT